MNSSETPVVQPTADDVKAFLRGTPAAPADLKAGVETALKPEDLGLAGTPAAPARPVAPELKPETTFSPDTATSHNLSSATLQGAVDFDPADIALTDAEKELFLEALLHDRPVQLELRLPGLPKLPVVVRSRSNFESEAAFNALLTDHNAGRLPHTSVWLAWTQYYHAAIALVAFNDKPLPALSATTKEEAARLTPDVLRAYVETHLAPLSGPKWNLLLNALWLFERKMTWANNSLLKRDFSQPAG